MAAIFKDQHDGVPKARERLFPRNSLAIRAEHFLAIRNKPLTLSLYDRGELVVHGLIPNSSEES